jgi:predicted lipid-binding transport protein (Tim44 family)
MVQAEDTPTFAAPSSRTVDFDHIFEYDHSGTHATQKPDGLYATNMRANWGGNNRPLIKEGMLGPFSPVLSIGDVQRMVFGEGDARLTATVGAPQRDYLTGKTKEVKKKPKKRKACGFVMSQAEPDSEDEDENAHKEDRQLEPEVRKATSAPIKASATSSSSGTCWTPPRSIP